MVTVGMRGQFRGGCRGHRRRRRGPRGAGPEASISAGEGKEGANQTYDLSHSLNHIVTHSFEQEGSPAARPLTMGGEYHQ